VRRNGGVTHRIDNPLYHPLIPLTPLERSQCVIKQVQILVSYLFYEICQMYHIHIRMFI